MPLYLNSANLVDISEAIAEAGDIVMGAFNQTKTVACDTVKPDMITTALRQLIDIMKMIEIDQASECVYKDQVNDYPVQRPSEIDTSPLSSEEISEIGDHGLSLIQTLSEWAGNLRLDLQEQQLQAVMVILSIWIARHGGYLRNLDTVVNTLADIANKTSDETILVELSSVVGEIIGAVDTDVLYLDEQDNDTREQCWRILNINRGIIATRTHQPGVMESVFEQLVQNIPDYAPVFFEKGIREVEELDYPEDIQLIMNRYYQKYNNNTLH